MTRATISISIASLVVLASLGTSCPSPAADGHAIPIAIPSHRAPGGHSGKTAHRNRAARRSDSLTGVLQIYPAPAARGGETETSLLARLYEHPDGGPSGELWVRANMVA